MRIIGKEFRSVRPILSHYVGEMRDILVEYEAFVYIYFYDEEIALRRITDAKNVDASEFGNLNESHRITRLKNIHKRVEMDGSKSSRNYKLSNRDIKIFWDSRDSKITFEGTVMLNGDAIRGTFFKNEKINISERVYYNIQKSLPEKLIDEV